ncbi:MAG: ATP-binding protein [Bryobacteraceae bacterium]|nr:ATP-binding protein [Bryobacteraceae bacterium]
MQDYEKLGAFYLGRIWDTTASKDTGKLLLYDSRDLVTHAVCVGMTGSGKTGLCIDLLEEAAIDGVPAIVIDPKGDISNLLLQFPQLRAEDFQPWVEPEEAQRQSIPVEKLAENEAERWRAGLAQWDQQPDRIQRLQESADFAVYTPGSTAGVPMSLLRSFTVPAASVLEDRELLRDRINGTATALLSLLGITGEPMKSREHTLLATLFDRTWQDGRSLTMEQLIHAVQQPPMERVGVVDLESFYPAKDRFELAMALNHLIASPGFEAWLEGEPIDIGKLLFTAEGKPRISILSIAHLSDSERMFFVTLVLNETLSWMRSQSGTGSLRAILYMDEIFGYFPPVANPPSKRPLLTLLKQARAFGVGIVLATQNPVDLDYKGLANAGTWFIGRLQTERDKERLMDGLEGAMQEANSLFDRGAIAQILSSLGKRVFLMHNVHESGPVTFETRWALSYLRGPMTRTQIRTLTKSRTPDETALPAALLTPSRRADPNPASAKPVVPPEIVQMYVPVQGDASDVFYRPSLLGAAQIRFVDTKAKIDFLREAVYLTPIEDDALPVEWEQCAEAQIDPNHLEREPAAGVDFASLPPAALKVKSYVSWQKALTVWIAAHQCLRYYASSSAGATSQPDESEGAFRTRLQHVFREQRDAQVEKLRTKYASKIATLQDRLLRAEQGVAREREEARSHQLNTAMDVGATVFGAMFGRRRITTAARSAVRGASRSSRQAGELVRAEETANAIAAQLDNLEAQFHEEVEKVQAGFDLNRAPMEVVALKPKKANVQIRLLTLAWTPFRKDGTPAW